MSNRLAHRLAAAGSPPMQPAADAEYGRYLANVAGCTGCHGPGLSGGAIIGAPPDWPHSANLTPSGEVGGWSQADFVQTIRTGVNPAGRQLSPVMPYMTFQHMTDDELGALWVYLKTVPAKEAGTR